MTENPSSEMRRPTTSKFSTALRKRPEVPLSIILLVVLISGWEAAIWLFAIPSIILPTPTAVVRALWSNLSTARFYMHVGVTLWEVVIGFLVGAWSGIIIGVSIGQWKLLDKTLSPYIVALQTVPKVAIAPMIVIWFGYGVASKIVITALIAFFPVVVNCIAGMNAASQLQIEMLHSFTATRWHVFRMVKIQTALPFIFAGLDIAVVLSVIGAIVGEFIGAQAGLGYLLLQRNFSMDTAGSFAILIVLSIIGITLHQIVAAVRRRAVFWCGEKETTATSSS